MGNYRLLTPLESDPEADLHHESAAIIEGMFVAVTFPQRYVFVAAIDAQTLSPIAEKEDVPVFVV